MTYTTQFSGGSSDVVTISFLVCLSTPRAKKSLSRERERASEGHFFVEVLSEFLYSIRGAVPKPQTGQVVQCDTVHPGYSTVMGALLTSVFAWESMYSMVPLPRTRSASTAPQRLSIPYDPQQQDDDPLDGLGSLPEEPQRPLYSLPQQASSYALPPFASPCPAPLLLTAPPVASPPFGGTPLAVNHHPLMVQDSASPFTAAPTHHHYRKSANTHRHHSQRHSHVLSDAMYSELPELPSTSSSPLPSVSPPPLHLQHRNGAADGGVPIVSCDFHTDEEETVGAAAAVDEEWEDDLHRIGPLHCVDFYSYLEKAALLSKHDSPVYRHPSTQQLSHKELHRRYCLRHQHHQRHQQLLLLRPSSQLLGFESEGVVRDEPHHRTDYGNTDGEARFLSVVEDLQSSCASHPQGVATSWRGVEHMTVEYDVVNGGKGRYSFCMGPVQHWTREEWWVMVESFAYGLRRLGLKAGQKIVIADRTRWEVLLACYASWMIGLVVVMVPPRLTTLRKVALELRDEVKAVICSRDHTVQQWVARCWREVSVQEQCRQQECEEQLEKLREEDEQLSRVDGTFGMDSSFFSATLNSSINGVGGAAGGGGGRQPASSLDEALLTVSAADSSVHKYMMRHTTTTAARGGIGRCKVPLLITTSPLATYRQLEEEAEERQPRERRRTQRSRRQQQQQQQASGSTIGAAAPYPTTAREERSHREDGGGEGLWWCDVMEYGDQWRKYVERQRSAAENNSSEDGTVHFEGSSRRDSADSMFAMPVGDDVYVKLRETDLALIFYASGSTGGIMHTHGALMAAMSGYEDHFREVGQLPVATPCSNSGSSFAGGGGAAAAHQSKGSSRKGRDSRGSHASSSPVPQHQPSPAPAAATAPAGTGVGAAERDEKDSLPPTYIAYLSVTQFITELVMEMVLLHRGFQICYGSPATLWDQQFTHPLCDVEAFSPTLLLGVPVVFQQLCCLIEASLTTGGFRRQLFDWSIQLRRQALRSHLDTPFLNRTAFYQPREMLGGRCSEVWNIGAPLSPSVQEFLVVVCGLKVHQVYGLKESLGCGLVQSSGDAAGLRSDVGGPLGPVEVKLRRLTGVGVKMAPRDTGELLLRGPTVMCGYYHQAQQTADVLEPTPEGCWLHTGDVAMRCEKTGAFHIKGQLRHSCTNSTGRTIAVEELEHIYAQHPLCNSSPSGPGAEGGSELGAGGGGGVCLLVHPYRSYLCAILITTEKRCQAFMAREKASRRDAQPAPPHFFTAASRISPPPTALEEGMMLFQPPPPSVGSSSWPACLADSSFLAAALRSLNRFAVDVGGIQLHERLRRVYIVTEEWTVNNHLRTVTGRLHRQNLQARHRRAIEEMFELQE